MAFNYTRKNAYDYETVQRALNNLNANSTYNKSAAVLAAEQAKAEHEANKVGDWTGGTYGQAVKDALDKINNREKFTYDLNGDMLYQQYKDQYINAGKMAMADTMGQAAALTGGYGNSYAATVGNQAYQGYLQKLNDRVPELYQMALNKYNQEGQDLKDNLAIQRALYDTEYSEYRNRVADWNAEQTRLDSNYFDESNMDYSRFSDNRNYYANLYNAAVEQAINDSNTDYNNAFARYQQQIAEDQWAQQFAETQRQNQIANEQWEKNYALQKASAAASKVSSGVPVQSAKALDKYVLQADKTKNGTYVYKNSAGKTQNVKLGQNPYTGGYNSDIKTNGKVDSSKIMKGSTYQPNNVGGKSLSKSGYKTAVNGIEVNVWTTGKNQYWIWDGTTNRYRSYDLKTDTYV